MAKYTVTIEGTRLEELDIIIAAILKDNPQSLITNSQYVQNVVNAFLDNRIKNKYVHHAQLQPVSILKEKFGDLKGLDDAQ